MYVDLKYIAVFVSGGNRARHKTNANCVLLRVLSK